MNVLKRVASRSAGLPGHPEIDDPRRRWHRYEMEFKRDYFADTNRLAERPGTQATLEEFGDTQLTEVFLKG